MFSTIYLYIFPHVFLVLLVFFLFSKLISRTFNYGQVSHYQDTDPLLKKKREKEIIKGQTQRDDILFQTWHVCLLLSNQCCDCVGLCEKQTHETSFTSAWKAKKAKQSHWDIRTRTEIESCKSHMIFFPRLLLFWRTRACIWSKGVTAVWCLFSVASVVSYWIPLELGFHHCTDI